MCIASPFSLSRLQYSCIVTAQWWAHYVCRLRCDMWLVSARSNMRTFNQYSCKWTPIGYDDTVSNRVWSGFVMFDNHECNRLCSHYFDRIFIAPSRASLSRLVLQVKCRKACRQPTNSEADGSRQGFQEQVSYPPWSFCPSLRISSLDTLDGLSQRAKSCTAHYLNQIAFSHGSENGNKLRLIQSRLA